MFDNLNSIDLIVIIDKVGKILYYNNFNDQINKLTESETIGKDVRDVYPWVSKKTPLFRVMKEKQPILNQVFNVSTSKNKSITTINSAYPLIGSNGLLGAIGFSISSDNLSTTENRPRKSFETPKYNFSDIITVDENMIKLKENLKKASKFDSNIFIYGDSGTGKELFAHSIHNESNRQKKPFVAQNCGAIPTNLMESTLFGTVKGGFTGAEDNKGLFDISNGGTLFLDEINSLPMELQAKLLRVLEDGFFRRVGDTKKVYFDVRIITSTNVPVESLLGKYLRNDLFYRLGVVNVEIPSLKNRPKDIEILSYYFISSFNNIFDKDIIKISNEALKVLNNYSWPGNVRELRNILESAFILIKGNVLTIDDLPERIFRNHNTNCIEDCSCLNEKIDAYEKSIISEALLKNKYHIVNTAKYLKIPRQTLYYKLNKYDLMN